MIATATREIGVRETSWNSGERVDLYLGIVNARPGNPWCAAFVSYCLTACQIKNPRSAWSPSYFPVKNLVHKDSAHAGDVFGLYFAAKKRIAHVGLIKSMELRYYVTVEGNTGSDDYGERTREGDGVYSKRRLRSQVYKIARWK